jgi:twitching motility protein PilT
MAFEMDNSIVTKTLAEAVEKKASDIFIVPGKKISMKINGEIGSVSDTNLLPDDTYVFIKEIYNLALNQKFEMLMYEGDDDFSFSLVNVGRFRVNAYRQRGSLSAVIRIVPFGLPDPSELMIPDAIIDFHKQTKGLVLVTGPAGSGKSTTLACIIDKINKTRNCHILTLEDPIEFLHRHNNSIVSQREVSIDTSNYVTALKAALRQSPDVILVGEMRDLETIEIVMTAAETGHLVLSSLHTIGAANTIDRIVDVFPAGQQQQIRIQLSMVLKGVVSQHLLPSEKLGRVPAFEIMTVNNAIRTLVRDNRVHQIESTIHSSGGQGMITMDTSLLRLYREGLISKEDTLMYATNSEAMKNQIG